MWRFVRKLRRWYDGRKKIKITSIKRLNFHYTVGCFMNSDVRYGISLEDGQYTACVKPSLKSDEEARVFAVDKSFVEEIRSFLSDMGVGGWNGFKKTDSRVCDGNNFDFRLETQDGQVLRAYGYARYPKRYGVVRERLKAMFEGLLEE